mmetsp:Transcript_41251/g.123137  ORF Transcript_41251/g.123137 Transcript_41251/m.123137 type:complete len:234 (+) Transcript_41251:2821-3522(+)
MLTRRPEARSRQRRAFCIRPTALKCGPRTLVTRRLHLHCRHLILMHCCRRLGRHYRQGLRKSAVSCRRIWSMWHCRGPAAYNTSRNSDSSTGCTCRATRMQMDASMQHPRWCLSSSPHSGSRWDSRRRHHSSTNRRCSISCRRNSRSHNSPEALPAALAAAAACCVPSSGWVGSSSVHAQGGARPDLKQIGQFARAVLRKPPTARLCMCVAWAMHIRRPWLRGCLFIFLKSFI